MKLGFALCGSFCTFSQVLPVLERLCAEHEVLGIMSAAACSTDTRFGLASDFKEGVRRLTGREVVTTVSGAEPIGPKALLDVLVVAPCTGNTLSKLAHGITDTSVTMACKAQLRNERPVVLALATNDGLSANAHSLGMLLPRKNVYFVPFGQDDAVNKPNSLMANFEMIPETIKAARVGRQLQPMLVGAGV